MSRRDKRFGEGKAPARSWRAVRIEERKMVHITINGTEVDAPEGQTILQAAKTLGIKIPTLCHHEALSAYGSCRLCIVEIKKKGGARSSRRAITPWKRVLRCLPTRVGP